MYNVLKDVSYMKDLLKKYDYVISDSKYDDDKVIFVESSSQFLDFFFKIKPLDKKIGFYGESKEIGKIECVYEFLKHYFGVLKKCEKEMEGFNKLIVLEDNHFVREAMEQFSISNASGKFLRAFLVSLGYGIIKDDDKWIRLAMALEIFQTSILIHDDIIDNADARRGIPTIPVRYGQIYSDNRYDRDGFLEKRDRFGDSMALCAGDIGLYLSNQMIVQNYMSNSNLGKILEYYNDMVIKTCKGEMIDVALPFYSEFYGNLDNLEENIIEIYKLKTGYYSVVGPFCLGYILAGGDKVSVLEDALMNLGIAYQIKDDILGVYGDEEKMGKSATSDALEYKQTILYSYTCNTSYKDELLSIYGRDDVDISKVREIFDKSGARKYADDYMNKLFQESFDAILDLDFIDSKHKKILLGFAEFLRVRDK